MPDYQKISENSISIPLPAYTIGFVFGAVQETAKHEQLAVVQLVGKDRSTTKVEETLKGYRGQAYKVVDKNHKEVNRMSDNAIVYGPFEDEKTIIIKLFWTYDSVYEICGSDKIGEIDEFDDIKLRTKITLIPVSSEVQALPEPPGTTGTGSSTTQSTLEAVVNCTRMKIKA